MSSASLQLGGDNWAAKDGNLLGYQRSSSSSVHIPHEFTFTRGSNLAATRVAANGLIEKGRENLLLRSNELDGGSWAKDDVTLTSGQSGYDGSTDAFLMKQNTNASRHHLRQSISFSGVGTFSVYAKEKELQYLQIASAQTTSEYANFDLSDGSVGNVGSKFIDAKATSVGGGWYRLSVVTTSGANAIYLSLITSKTAAWLESYTGANATDGLYIQDAQLEQGLVATDYIETGATTVQAGLLEDEPRIDYTGGTGSLLLEPSRTNLIGYSEYFNIWLNSGAQTIVVNASTSPQGLQNASSIQIDSGYIYKQVSGLSISVGDKYVWSCYVNSSSQKLTFGGGTISGTDVYSSEDVGSGWYRQILTRTFTSSGGAIQPMFNAAQSGTDLFYIWGAQLEEGSYATSYIPNHSGGSVTRGVDVFASPNISSMVTGSSFTWFLDLNDYIGSDSNNRTLRIANSTNIEIQLRVRPDGYRFYYNNIAGGSAYPIAGSTTANKFCVSYDGSNYRLYIDGILEATTASVGDSLWNAILNIQNATLSINQMLLFPTALSDAQCSALTVEGLKEEILTSYIAAVDTLEDGAEARLDTYLQNLEDLIV